MAISSYSSLFGTNGAGRSGSGAGIPRPIPEPGGQGGGAAQQPAQTFAQLQKQGMARPAPQGPQAQPFERYGGSEQAGQARTAMLGQLQQQLAQPTRFDTEAFKQIRQAQAQNLQAEYGAEQSRLNEELARRGLSASSIGGGRMGDLAGQQARALASLDAQLLQQAAQTQAQDRLAAMQAAGQFTELAGAQDLAQFEANRVAQAAEFQQALQGAQFGQLQTEFERGQALQAAQAQQAARQNQMELGLREALGLAEITGEVGGQQTLAARQQAEQRRQFDLQQALQRELGVGSLGIQQAELAQRGTQFTQAQALERERLAAQQQQFGAQLGFSREELALRGELGRGEQQIAENRLAQEGRLQEAQQAIQLKEIGQRQSQFESTLNADEQRFVRTLKEQQDARLQQLGISDRELNLRASQIKQEGELQGRSLTLQEARDEAEIGYRKEALAQEGNLRGIALNEQRLEREARDAFQRDQLAVEDRLRTEGIAVDRERLTAAQRQFDAQLTEQTRQSDLDRQLRETLGMGELTGMVGGQETVSARTARNNLLVQLASAMAGSEKGIPAGFLQQLYAALGIYSPPGGDNQENKDEKEAGKTTGTTSTGTTTTTPPSTSTDKTTGTK